MSKAEIIKELYASLHRTEETYDSLYYSIRNLAERLEQEPKTNRDKINNMNNLELALFLLELKENQSKCYICNSLSDCKNCCVNGVQEWLESEV